MHHSIKFLLTPILTLIFLTNAQALMPDDDEIPTGEDHSDSSDKTTNSQAFMPEEDEIPTGDGHMNSSDKSGYTLFNPTPRDLWRPMSADRPDFTESPITVDAGAVQVELSFLDYATNGDQNALSVAPVNIKLGLLNNVDLQFVVDPYVNSDDGTSTNKGVSDIQFRLKINLWGNDEGETAFAIMPFITIPTGSDGISGEHVEGGFIFPFAMGLTESIGMGLMFETDFVYDDLDSGFDTEFVATGVLGFDVTDAFGLYVEGIAIESTDSDVSFRGILGCGATYSLTNDIMFDAGVNIGLVGDGDDVNIFTGITFRF